jgi:hypothetical protein
MGREALLKLGVARREAERIEAAYRRQDQERLERQSATGDIYAAKERMFAADRRLPDEPTEPA